MHLKLQGLTLLLLFTTQLEVLTSLQSQLSLGLANNTFQSQHNLLGGLSFLVENLLGLTTETGLLTVVTSLTLSVQGSLTGLVLGNLVLGVLAALLTLTVGLSGLWNVNCGEVSKSFPCSGHCVRAWGFSERVPTRRKWKWVLHCVVGYNKLFALEYTSLSSGRSVAAQ